MRKRLLLGGTLALLLSIIAAGTAANTAVGVQTRNVITTGTVEIALDEKTATSSGLIEFPTEGLIIMPATDSSRRVKVRNTGTSDAWVRVCVQISVTDESGRKELDASPVTVLRTADTQNTGTSVIPGSTEDDFWMKKTDADGTTWYYCRQPVSAGGETCLLFSRVLFGGNMGNEYQNGTVKIKLEAQAVQTAHNGDIQNLTAENYDEISGWPDFDAAFTY